MRKEHQYSTILKWTGNRGNGTINYRAYERSHIISVIEKPDIYGSSDPAFRGDKTKYNPEELLLASISSCHMLWFLHLSAVSAINVLEYSDKANGSMIELENGGGRFKEVILNPKVVVSKRSMLYEAFKLHKKANEFCFIANSLNFEIKHNPTCLVEQVD